MSDKPKILVFCERIDNESFCESVVRELDAYYDVRAFGPNWPKTDFSDLDLEDARFYLELDSASGNFYRPRGLDRLRIPRFAWFIDTHKKPDFHRQVAREMDSTFHAMKNWGHVLGENSLWLPLHCDTRIFHPIERERDLDIVFVGSYAWRAAPILEIARKHGLKVHVECTTGEREKTRTAELYARAKLVFNKHVSNDLNFRVFEATACGRVLLTDAQWNGQYELFRDGEHYVLYTGEKDLETKVLALLKDDWARARIEKAAAEHSERNHSTRARVAQLREQIEAHLRAVSPSAERGEGGGGGPRAHVKRRWLFFAGEEPATVARRTYAERLAWSLAERGDDVVIARARRGLLPARGRTVEGEPRVIEIDAGPVPATTGPNRTLQAAAALHRRFERLVRDLGKFDAIVGEGALGGLVAQPVAARHGIPFVLALPDCEVLRRSNRLTREQLYWAELEHWAVARAKLVVVPWKESANAIERHYGSKCVRTLGWSPPSVAAPVDARRLLHRLGFENSPYTVFLTSDPGDGDLRRTLATVDVAVAVTPNAAWAKHSGVVRKFHDGTLAGASLAALLSESDVCVALAARDPRAIEARALGCRVQGAEDKSAPCAIEVLDDVFAEWELAHAIQ